MMRNQSLTLHLFEHRPGRDVQASARGLHAQRDWPKRRARSSVDETGKPFKIDEFAAKVRQVPAAPVDANATR